MKGKKDLDNVGKVTTMSTSNAGQWYAFVACTQCGEGDHNEYKRRRRTTDLRWLAG